MKRTLPFLAVMVLLIFAIATAGCGDSGEDQRVEMSDILLEEGSSFTFEGNEGDLIVFSSDNTFRAVIAREVEDGDYEIFQSEDAIRLELVFANRDEGNDEFESWDIGENEDGIVVLTGLQGQSFTLRGSEKGLRRK